MTTAQRLTHYDAPHKVHAVSPDPRKLVCGPDTSMFVITQDSGMDINCQTCRERLDKTKHLGL